jgi:FixJ family two-component response regulator
MSFGMLQAPRREKTTAMAPVKQSVFVAGTMRCVQDSLQTILRQCDVSVQCFTTSRECLAELEPHPFDLLIVCMDDEPHHGLELVMQSKCIYPATPILAIVREGDVALAVRVMKAGATDCLEATLKMAGLHSTILDLLRQHCARNRRADLGLTKTESLVLAYILEGRTNREIASLLHRSQRTIEVHRQAIMHKLRASGMVDLFKRAASLGLMVSSPPFGPKDFAQYVRT